MSESMALERMAEMLAQMKGYATTTRVPYHARRSGKGQPKTDATQGDLDVVGLRLTTDRRSLLLIECKGYGGAEEYFNWLNPTYLSTLQDAASIATNIKRVSDDRWDAQFRRRKYRPDELWLVFSGFLYPAHDPRRWKQWWKQTNWSKYDVFLSGMQSEATRIYDHPDDEKHWTRSETVLLRRAELLLARPTKVKSVRLYPIHRLLTDLFEAVAGDLRRRRKRYPDTALELLRWMARAIANDCLRLGDLDAQIKAAMLRAK